MCPEAPVPGILGPAAEGSPGGPGVSRARAGLLEEAAPAQRALFPMSMWLEAAGKGRARPAAGQERSGQLWEHNGLGSELLHCNSCPEAMG